MPSNMPPVPPDNRGREWPRNSSKVDKPRTKAVKNRSVKQVEQHHNAAEEGETANVKQNTTNKGFFRGRRMG